MCKFCKPNDTDTYDAHEICSKNLCYWAFWPIFNFKQIFKSQPVVDGGKEDDFWCVTHLSFWSITLSINLKKSYSLLRHLNIFVLNIVIADIKIINTVRCSIPTTTGRYPIRPPAHRF